MPELHSNIKRIRCIFILHLVLVLMNKNTRVVHVRILQASARAQVPVQYHTATRVHRLDEPSNTLPVFSYMSQTVVVHGFEDEPLPLVPG